MPQNYVPIFIFIAIVGSLLPITLMLAKLVRPSNPSKAKLMPYECGIDPIDSARGRYTVRYYIIAILFVVFDVETIFLFPWAVRFKAFGLFGLLEMLIFLAILMWATSGCGKRARWNGCRAWYRPCGTRFPFRLRPGTAVPGFPMPPSGLCRSRLLQRS